jgi:hypothetical protein
MEYMGQFFEHANQGGFYYADRVTFQYMLECLQKLEENYRKLTDLVTQYDPALLEQITASRKQFAKDLKKYLEKKTGVLPEMMKDPASLARLYAIFQAICEFFQATHAHLGNLTDKIDTQVLEKLPHSLQASQGAVALEKILTVIRIYAKKSQAFLWA